MSEIIVDEQWAATRDHSVRNRIERRDGHTVRTIADIDHHYHFQSSVTSHLLTPDGWTFIHSVPTHRLQNLRPDRDPSTAEGLFMSCHETTFTILAGVSDAVAEDAYVYCTTVTEADVEKAVDAVWNGGEVSDEQARRLVRAAFKAARIEVSDR